MLDKFLIFNGFHNHKNYLFVNENEFVVGEGRDLIGTDGVSSCLVITLWDVQKKRGALAHISGLDDSPEELRTERIVDTLLHQLDGSGKIDYSKLEATLSGEGIILFKGQRNSSIVRTKIKDYGIPIIGEDLCRAPGRLVFLYCDTGGVEVYRC